MLKGRVFKRRRKDEFSEGGQRIAFGRREKREEEGPDELPEAQKAPNGKVLEALGKKMGRAP